MSPSRMLVSILLLLALLLTLAPISGTGVVSANGSYEKAIVTARTGVWNDINSGKAGSATVAIMDSGKIVYSEGFGMADREKGIPVDRNTLFNIGSISKAFTATAVMLLVDQGRLSLDDPVTRYLPEFTMADPRYKNITVRMLLDHTSGLAGSTFANQFGFEYDKDAFPHLLTNLTKAHLRHAPGEMAVYTNDGFTLAEMIVERVSGKTFMDFLAENVFKPLDMQNTGRGVGEQPGKIAAYYYQPASGKREPLEVLSVLGAGGLSSTAEDLMRFADTFSYSGNRIFSRSALEEMKRAQPPLFWGKLRNPEFAYGLGLDFTDIPPYKSQGIKIIGKSGGTMNYSSMFYTDPEHRLSVAVIETGASGSAMKIALDVMDALLVQKGLIKSQTKSISRPAEPQAIPKEYTGFEGYYSSGNNLVKVAIDLKENTVNLSTLKRGVETPAGSLIYNGGYLYDETGERSYFTAVGDKQYYVGSSAVDNIQAEKLVKLADPQSLRIDMNGKQWVRRNVKPFESISIASGHFGKSSTNEVLPGYIDFGAIVVVKSPDFAGMPIGAMRDLSELWLLEKEGQTWIQLNDMLYSPASVASALKKGENTVTLGSSGYNEWLKTDEDLILSFKKPAKGRIIVFSPEGPPMYDSAVDQGDLYVKKGSFVEFAGVPGDVLKITAK